MKNCLSLPALLLLSLLVGTSGSATAENSFRNGACNGTYTLHSAGAVGTAGPMTIPVGKPVLTGAQIELGQCGRELVLTADGVTAVLYQEVMNDRIYSGSLDMGDGAKRRLTLTVGDDRNLRGSLVATDGHAQVTRPLWVMLTKPSETRFEGCVDDDEELSAPRGLSHEATVVLNHLSSLGFVPAESLQFEDYVAMKSPDAQSTHVSLRISREGAVLPRPEIAAEQMDDASAYCIGDERLDPARQVLDFKVAYADEDPFVFARIIDIETGKILQQVEGKPAKAGEGALQSAVEDAWLKLSPPLTQMTDGVLR